MMMKSINEYRAAIGNARLASEAVTRRSIETALRVGIAPENNNPSMDAKRYRLVVIQERKRIAGEVAPFSCSCEGSDTLSQMDDEQENEYIASLPSDEEANSGSGGTS
jgi:hypothetical protein